MKRILVLSANPHNTSQLRLAEEVREVEAGLKQSLHRDQFELMPKSAVRLRDFYRHLLEVKPHILHFSGHGGGEHGLVLEDDNGKVQFLQTEQLADMFRLFATKGLECVVLNACYSEVQAKAINQFIPYVIGMNQAIGDRAAITFAVAFYDTLGAGESVEFAFELAKSQLIGLKEDQKLELLTNAEAIARLEPNPSQNHPDSKSHALKLLQTLLPAQFETVVFRYDVPPADMTNRAPQSQLAIEVIRYAEQVEGKSLARLFQVIYEVAPHLKR